MLVLRVLNVGHGDSLLLRLPRCQGDHGQRWGLIDCHTVSGSHEPPALSFLKKRTLKDGELQFLCLSHPHRDHIIGMARVFDHFAKGKKIRQFWFSTPPSCFRVPYNKQATGSVFSELDTIYGATVGNETKRPDESPRLRLCLEGKDLTLKGDIEVSTLSPDKQTYGTIDTMAQEAMQDREHNTFKTEILDGLSMVLSIRYGYVQLLLCADAEAANWTCIVTKSESEETDLTSHVIKVAHHGSHLDRGTAFHQRVWQRIADPNATTAVISCGTEPGHPAERLVEAISRHAAFIACTGKPLLPVFLVGWPADIPRHTARLLDDVAAPLTDDEGEDGDGDVLVKVSRKGKIWVQTESGRRFKTAVQRSP